VTLGLVAGFGVRDPKESGACAAFAASHSMLQSFAPVAARWRDEFAGVTGIGLHSSEVALGRPGPPGRQAITMIGDTANVAARLCSRAGAGEVLFSCLVAAALRDAGLDGPYVCRGTPILSTDCSEIPKMRTASRL